MFNRRDLLARAPLGLLGAAAGSGWLLRAAEAQDSGTLAMAYPADVPHWDAIGSSVGIVMPIYKCVFDNPINLTPDLKIGPSIITSYKWLGGPTVSQQDAYGESMYRIDPYLSVQIHQRLPNFIPGHAELVADCGNLLGQGYVALNTSDGGVVLVPTYRYFRGGLSFQF